MKLLHITAHLGGGVGKVLSRLVEASARRGDGIEHTIACLEAPEKPQFATHVEACGGTLVCAPTPEALDALVQAADLVQLEWWHHPVVARWLCAGPLPAMRLVVWSHVSGLHAPELLPAFVRAPHRFLLTSPCSLHHPALAPLAQDPQTHLGVVFSSGGFDDLPPPPQRAPDGPLRVGYLGTLNFAKLHPALLDFVGAVRDPAFSLSLVGDPTTATALHSAAVQRGLAGRIRLCGYTTDVAATLAGFDVFAYVLNPRHYGTTENALLEAMAMGVVPVVLDNPAERELVAHRRTGLIVHTPAEFADAIAWLAAHPAERQRLAANAAAEVRARFAVDRTADALDAHYRAVLSEPKRGFDFRPIFGATPADWFLNCQGSARARFGSPPRATDTPHHLLERTKGSVFHYHATFPDDPRLAAWARQLEHAR